MAAVRYLDLAPGELAQCQRLFAAAEKARQDYQDYHRAILEKKGIDADGLDIKFNPWTGRFTLPEEAVSDAARGGSTGRTD